MPVGGVYEASGSALALPLRWAVRGSGSDTLVADVPFISLSF
jgi:hypothetical protein